MNDDRVNCEFEDCGREASAVDVRTGRMACSIHDEGMYPLGPGLKALLAEGRTRKRQAAYAEGLRVKCPTCGASEDTFVDGDCPACNPPVTS